jgi:hypothetical protein
MASRNGSIVFLMASVDIRVAMMGILWMVLTRTELSSLSSYSLKNSKGLLFYMELLGLGFNKLKIYENLQNK